MTDVDKKLREIAEVLVPRTGEIDGMTDAIHEATVNTAVAQIKQAFTDAGWVDARINTTDDPLYLTGQEWYDRFDKELRHPNVDIWKNGRVFYLDVKAAAKKASGIQDA